MVHRDDVTGQPGSPVGLDEKGPNLPPVDGFCCEFTDGHLYAELFRQLPGQAGLDRFTGFHFAPGEFPQPGQRLRRGPPGDEYRMVVNQKCGRDFDHDARLRTLSSPCLSILTAD